MKTTTISLSAILACLTLISQELPRPVGRGVDRNGDGGLGPGEHTRTITVGILQRRYRVHMPKNYDADHPTPVIVAFHGGGGNPESMARLSGLNGKADEAGFVVVYPYGTGRFAERLLTFNAGNVGGYAKEKNVDDVGFARALLDDLAKIVNVDTNRVFATGISNGGMMAYRLASELSDRIAAIAPVGGPMGTATCKPTRPVSIIHFHGTADELAPFKGGKGKGFPLSKDRPEFFSVDHSIRNWVQANGCASEPTVIPFPDKADDGMRVTRKTWSGGKDGSEVVLIEIGGGGHTWPGMEPPFAMLGKSTKDISANDLMLEFFQQHPMKPAAAHQVQLAADSLTANNELDWNPDKPQVELRESDLANFHTGKSLPLPPHSMTTLQWETP